jgi:hypothetical protein
MTHTFNNIHSTMARFTNIGMPRKTFVASAAEEARTEKEAPASPPPEAGPSTDSTSAGGKRKGWGRDPEIASACLAASFAHP